MGYLVRAPIDVGQLIESVSSAEHGGTATFVGSVRRGPEDGPVVAIEYSAYEAMAETQMDRIMERVAKRWPQARVEVRHRLGRVATREASVAVAVSAPHRAEAFAVCRFVIEQLKRHVPIWKREILESGEERWRGDEGPAEEHQ